MAGLHPPPTPLRWAGLLLDRPRVMGILNATPDSFSDGGRHHDSGAAIAAGLAMAEAGADIVDIGGESTRPGADVIGPEQEQARILPVVRALARAGIRVSVDTRNAATMAAALDGGAMIVNDVSALGHDPAAAGLLGRRGAAVVLMHMRGNPATMQGLARYGDVAGEIAAELRQARDRALAAGIAAGDIALDPGIGFAKQAAHNLAALRGLDQLAALGHPVLVGLSRKAFIGAITGQADPARRLPGSLAAGLFAIARGAHILRVHDVPETIAALKLWTALATPATIADHVDAPVPPARPNAA